MGSFMSVFPENGGYKTGQELSNRNLGWKLQQVRCCGVSSGERNNKLGQTAGGNKAKGINNLHTLGASYNWRATTNPRSSKINYAFIQPSIHLDVQLFGVRNQIHENPQFGWWNPMAIHVALLLPFARLGASSFPPEEVPERTHPDGTLCHSWWMDVDFPHSYRIFIGFDPSPGQKMTMSNP